MLKLSLRESGYSSLEPFSEEIETEGVDPYPPLKKYLKELKKDFRLKLKKNKKINDDSYFITLKGFKDFKISANYSEHSNITTVFFKPQKAWYNINKIVFNYQDQKEKKLEKITIFSNQFITGDFKIFEFKK